MNKIVLGLSMLTLTANFASAQHVFNPQNARDGETVEYCHQHTLMERYKTENPALYQSIMQGQQELKEHAKTYNAEKSETVYTIPIVFHILHNNGDENISKEQVEDAVAVLNRDFRLLNADANNVVAAFQSLPADAFIEFRLATIAPNGQCFGGITRTLSSLADSDNGQAQLNAAWNGNDVYQGTWDHKKYLNVLVAKGIGGAAGYTQYPNDWGASSNSIYILHQYLGRIGTGSEPYSRALTHEVGHWLNLQHVWGDTNNPGVASNCSNDDGVTDTPNTVGVTTCKLNEATCGPLANVENYMDYSYCSKMYTPGQVDRMRAAITASTGGRNQMWKPANLAAVGAIDNPAFCKADFRTNNQIICAGQTVSFIDESISGADEWSWSFTGGTPATSTTQNPSVIYNTPGTYAVTLTSKKAGVSKTATKPAYITVIAPQPNIPMNEGFETLTSMSQAGTKWFVENVSGDNNKFEVTTQAAKTGSKSLKLQNFSAAAGNIDNLVSGTYDLSNETLNNVTFSYRYAHKKKSSGNKEFLKVYFSNDCGETWNYRNPTTSSLSASAVVPTNWISVASADWKTIHIPFNTAAYSSYLNSNFRFKFEFTSDGGNNLFIDDINLYRGAPSDEPVLGVTSIETMSGINLYPNPSENEVVLSFALENAQQVALTITDLTGKTIQTTVLKGNEGINEVLINSSEYANGMYLIHLNSGNSNKTLQFIKR